MPTTPPDHALCGSHIHIAGAGDELDGVEAQIGNPVREGADSSGAAHGIHLLDAEQAGRAEDGGVHSPVEALLSGGSQGHGCDAGDLRRHDVHHDARRVDGLAAGNVEADAIDRGPALDHLGAGRQRRDAGLGHLGLGGGAHPHDRLLESCAHGWVELSHR